MTSFYTNAIESGNYILLRGYEDGKAFSRKVKYKPTIYIQSQKQNAEWRSLDGIKLDAVIQDDMKDAKDFIKRYEGVNNFKLFGFPRFVYSFLNEEYPGEIDYDRELIRIINIDIEVDSENGFPLPEHASQEVTLITLKKAGKIYVFGCGEYSTDRKDVIYRKCRDERELLLCFMAEWERDGYPDIVTGYNINFFDIPYLINRITNLLGEKVAERLSPWKFFTSRSVTIMGREQTSMAIAGIAPLDYLEMYKKFTYTQQDSYRLDNIAHIELGDKKVDYSEYGSLHNLYRQDYTKFVNYGIHDVELVERLDDKMGFINMLLALAYDAKANYIDAFSQVRMWDVLINNHLSKKKIAVPMDNIGGEKHGAFEGAHVKPPQVGMHKYVASVDLDGLYPHLIMQYNISPEKLSNHPPANITVDQCLDKSFVLPLKPGFALAPNGHYFSCSGQGFLAEMMQTMYNDRVIYKKKMLECKSLKEKETDPLKLKELTKLIARYDNMQKAKKIQLNSAYGAIGNQYFRFYDLRLAMAITIGGQLAIRWAEQELNKYLNKIMGTTDFDYIIAADTDSLYINFGPLVERTFATRNILSEEAKINFLDKVIREKIEPKIKDIYQELADRMSAFQQKMNMKREVIADRGLWTAKKRYILNVHDSEGVRYKEPELKIMGLEAIKSSTPASCREAIKEAMKIIMRGNENSLQEYVAKFRGEFNKMRFEDIAFPRGMQGLNEYKLGDKSIPIHVRGALSFNQMIINNKLEKKYELIRDGDKIKFCYLKTPNKTQNNVLAISHVLPDEFDLNDVIDYEIQFEKAFVQPIRAILDVINWTDVKVNNLEEFFT